MQKLNLGTREIPNTVEALVEAAIHDRFSLIIPEEWEIFARQHLKEILELYTCTGILLLQNRPGIAYHRGRRAGRSQHEILSDGVHNTTNENASFGDGVIYCYADIDKFNGFINGKPLWRLTYSKCLRSIYKDDTPYSEWEEILVDEKDLLDTELLGDDSYDKIIDRLSRFQSFC